MKLYIANHRIPGCRRCDINNTRKYFRSFCIFTSFLLFFLTFSMPARIIAQNLLDIDHSRKYGQYLFDTRQYRLAIEEWERVLFLSPGDDTARYQLIRSFNLGNDYNDARLQLNRFFPDPVNMPGKYAIEYSKALLLMDSVKGASDIIRDNLFLSTSEKLFLQFNLDLNTDWEKAINAYKSNPAVYLGIDRRYGAIALQIESMRSKSPALASALSAVIPGSGKVYTGDWKDGLISLLFVGATSFQAIRGYNLYGPKSGFFISYSAIASAFYLGNIYGSYKSAKRHNEKSKRKIQDSIRTVFLDHL
jgi:hypothetical protein